MKITDELYRKILDNMDEGVYFVDTKRIITYFNKAAEKITGYKKEEVLGSSCRDNLFNHIDEDGDLLCLRGCPLHETIKDGDYREQNVYLHHKNGHRIPVRVRASQIVSETGEILGAVETFSDKTEYHKIELDNKYLRTIALKDKLTDLPNRRYLEEWLISKQREFVKFSYPYAVLVCDIDNFKSVNDKYGHIVGDDILVMVANTLRNTNRQTDLVSRYGGEEFVIVLSAATEEKVTVASRRMANLVYKSAVPYKNTEIRVSISIGAAISKKGDSIPDIIQRADEYLYISKKNGKNRITSDFGEMIIGREIDVKKQIFEEKRIVNRSLSEKQKKLKSSNLDSKMKKLQTINVKKQEPQEQNDDFDNEFRELKETNDVFAGKEFKRAKSSIKEDFKEKIIEKKLSSIEKQEEIEVKTVEKNEIRTQDNKTPSSSNDKTISGINLTKPVDADKLIQEAEEIHISNDDFKEIAEESKHITEELFDKEFVNIKEEIKEKEELKVVAEEIEEIKAVEEEIEELLEVENTENIELNNHNIESSENQEKNKSKEKLEKSKKVKKHSSVFDTLFETGSLDEEKKEERKTVEKNVEITETSDEPKEELTWNDW